MGSTNETFNQSYSNDFDSSEAPTFLGCFKHPVPRNQEASNNHMHSCSPAGRLESHQRSFGIETPFQMQKTKALSWLFPECVRRVEKQSTKAGRFFFLGGGTCSGNTRGKAWDLTRLAHQISAAWPCHGWDSSRWLPAQEKIPTSLREEWTMRPL